MSSLKIYRRALHGIKRLDHSIRWSIDRILPQNLTSRYLIGLGVVAALAIAGQMVIQISFSRQIETQDRIRLMDSRQPVTETLRRECLALELSSSIAEMKKHLVTITELNAQLFVDLERFGLDDDEAGRA